MPIRTVFAITLFAGLAGAAPALADTLSEVTSHGVVITIGDMDIQVNYTPDHKLNAMDGQVTGTWRIDGEKLCTTSNVDPVESCYAYPKDKKSGDSFVIDTPNGSVPIKIR
ncbi:MAG: hypothetical protein ACJ798_10960 [Phenylobacterium sp.]